jgi:GntR family transcriptional regulator
VIFVKNFNLDSKPENIPLYVGAYQKLLSMIRGGDFGDKLPSETELSKLLNISRNTLRQALQVLEEDHIIYKRRGSGTYISKAGPISTNNGLESYMPIEEYLSSMNIEATPGELVITIEEADEPTSRMLQVGMQSPVIVITRTYVDKMDSNLVYGLLLDFVPQNIYEEYVEEQIINKKDFYKCVERLSSMSETMLTATRAGKVNADIMHVSESTPLLLMVQVVMDSKGNRLFLNKTYLNIQAEGLDIVIHRKPKP